MLPNKRRKRSSSAHAAYGASQPLYDALRLGLDKLDSQRSKLAAARDIVRNLHVKIISEDVAHENYVENITTTWQALTEVYAGIFKHLTDVTAADPSEGKQASVGHEQFEAILQSIFVARNVAVQFARIAKASMKAAQSSRNTPDRHRSRDAASASKARQSPKMTLPLINSNGKRPLSYDETEDETAGKSRTRWTMWKQPVSEYVEQYFEQKRKTMRDFNRKNAQSAGKHGKKSVPREAQAGGATESAEAGRLPRIGVTTPGSGNATSHCAPPTTRLQYEDVSAEAAARLEAKKATRRSHQEVQQRKKRKRDSAGSLMKAHDSQADHQSSGKPAVALDGSERTKEHPASDHSAGKTKSAAENVKRKLDGSERLDDAHLNKPARKRKKRRNRK